MRRFPFMAIPVAMLVFGLVIPVGADHISTRIISGTFTIEGLFGGGVTLDLAGTGGFRLEVFASEPVPRTCVPCQPGELASFDISFFGPVSGVGRYRGTTYTFVDSVDSLEGLSLTLQTPLITMPPADQAILELKVPFTMSADSLVILEDEEGPHNLRVSGSGTATALFERSPEPFPGIGHVWEWKSTRYEFSPSH